MHIGHTERVLLDFIKSRRANEGPNTFKVDQNTHLNVALIRILYYQPYLVVPYKID